MNRTAAGLGCLVAFLLPFAAAGGFTAVQCVRFASQGNGARQASSPSS